MKNIQEILVRKNNNGATYTLFKEEVFIEDAPCDVYGISIENDDEKYTVSSITSESSEILNLFDLIFKTNTYPYNLHEIIEDFIV